MSYAQILQMEQAAVEKSTLEFPRDLSTQTDNHMMFQRYKYRRAGVESTSSPEAIGSAIVLPVPRNLQNVYAVDWSNTELGMSGAFITKNLGSLAGNFINNVQAHSGSMSISDMVSSAYDAWQKSGVGMDTLKSGALTWGIEGATSFDIVERALFGVGMARNPHKAFMFQSPNFRTYNFSYTMIAKNYEESVTIRDIIRNFRVGMAPSFTENMQNNLFDYPDMFEISFGRPEFLWRFMTSVLTDFAVNYHGSGSPAYFERDGQKIPAIVEISMSFQETEIVTRENIERGNF